MDIFAELMKNVSGNTNEEATRVAEISSSLAASRKGASQQTSAVIECIASAASPLMQCLYQSNTPLQDRLLFTLVLTGACVTLIGSDDNGDKVTLGMECEVSPSTLQDAIQTYIKLTGRDIRPHLPPAMIEFAGAEQLMN